MPWACDRRTPLAQLGPEGGWEGLIQSIQSLTSREKSKVCQHGCAAIVDSGTSLIAAPASALMELGHLIGQIKEDCAASVDCVWIVCGVV